MRSVKIVNNKYFDKISLMGCLTDYSERSYLQSGYGRCVFTLFKLVARSKLPEA